MLNQTLIDAFKYWRLAGRSVERAYAKAVADTACRTNRYPSTIIGGMRGGEDFKIGSSDVFFCEQPDTYLRRVGYADEVAKLDHNGWYLDDDGSDELVRGVVFQLPARNGKPQYVPAVADPFNDGPAMLCMYLRDDNKEDAARFADHLAKVYAENERDYRRAWNAGQRFAYLGEMIEQGRANIHQLAKERRALRKMVKAGEYPAACAALVKTMRMVLSAMVDARGERIKLADAFDHIDAFNEAASEGG